MWTDRWIDGQTHEEDNRRFFAVLQSAQKGIQEKGRNYIKIQKDI